MRWRFWSRPRFVPEPDVEEIRHGHPAEGVALAALESPHAFRVGSSSVLRGWLSYDSPETRARLDAALEPLDVSWFFEHNAKTYADSAKVPRNVTFADPAYLVNLRETINGFSFGHTPGLTMQTGERVRWYVFANSNFEIHTPHWHGQTVVAHRMRTDMVQLMAMQMLVADMVPDNPGQWMFHCHVDDHILGGMQALYRVLPAR